MTINNLIENIEMKSYSLNRLHNFVKLVLPFLILLDVIGYFLNDNISQIFSLVITLILAIGFLYFNSLIKKNNNIKINDFKNEISYLESKSKSLDRLFNLYNKFILNIALIYVLGMVAELILK